MIKTFICLALIYSALLILAYCFADDFIFYPPATSYKENKNILKIKVTADEKIAAIYLPNEKAQYTLLVNHGNAEDLGSMQTLLWQFQKHGFAVFAYDYRGYGRSDGKASEKNTYADADAAYHYLINILKIPASRIIIYGHSLGSALAIYLAAKHRAAGLIIESPFISAFRVVTVIPVLPFDKFNNLKRISQIHIPTLVIHGHDDGVIPFWHGVKIYNQLRVLKQHYWVQGAGHNDIHIVASEYYWKVFYKFIATVSRNSSK